MKNVMYGMLGGDNAGGGKGDASLDGSAEDATAASREISGYVLEREIARGGMGVIYRARHPHAKNRIVALKRVSGLAKDDSQSNLRFRAEVEAAAVHLPQQSVGRIPLGVFRVFALALLVGGREYDGADELLHRPAVRNKFRSQVIEQFRVRRLLGADAKVARRFHQTLSE